MTTTAEKRRFTTLKYSFEEGGYTVCSYGNRIATFVDEGLAVNFCKMLRLFPGMANNYRNLTAEELREIAQNDPLSTEPKQ